MTQNNLDLNDKVILVTGGTGSFGRKFTEVVLKKWQPKKLIIFSRDEYKQLEMAREFDSPALRFFIGDVRDGDRLHRAMRGVDIVIHAAALKQVPACEYNPFEAVKTNILGGANVIDAAIDCEVGKVLAISSDKAVNPINLYGATKLCAEKLFVQGNFYSTTHGTRFSCARYGNVVGSRGSVIPLFIQQRSNGTVTVTDERMTRFWLTLENGVEFVLKALGAMRGGEIFVPKIPSMRIIDLVKTIAPNCTVKFTGIRPGEKIHEVLISEDEARQTVQLEDMFVIYSTHDGFRLSDAPLSGKPLSEGFRFASDQNDQWLTMEQLKVMAGLVETEENARRV